MDSEKSPEAETKNPNELQHTEMKETQINPIDTTEKVNSVAIVEDTGGFSGIIVAAHELGHL